MYRKSFLKRFPQNNTSGHKGVSLAKEKAEKIPMLPIYTFKG